MKGSTILGLTILAGAVLFVGANHKSVAQKKKPTDFVLRPLPAGTTDEDYQVLQGEMPPDLEGLSRALMCRHTVH